MGRNTRIYNRFKWWSVADCNCKHCVHYAGKNRPCPLDVCCCEDIRQEAIRRETTAELARTSGISTSGEGGASSCRE